MRTALPQCRTVSVFGFRGDRTRPFVTSFQKSVSDAKTGLGSGPTISDCLLFAGHTGVSVDGGAAIYGFNPNGAGLAAWQLMEELQRGSAFPGVVRDDTQVFVAARKHPLAVVSFEIVFPEPQFQEFVRKLDAERQSSNYSYGFPDGDGDCNCATWLERQGLPLLSGGMDELSTLRGISVYPSRRFGKCL